MTKSNKSKAFNQVKYTALKLGVEKPDIHHLALAMLVHEEGRMAIAKQLKLEEHQLFKPSFKPHPQVAKNHSNYP